MLIFHLLGGAVYSKPNAKGGLCDTFFWCFFEWVYQVVELNVWSLGGGGNLVWEAAEAAVEDIVTAKETLAISQAPASAPASYLFTLTVCKKVNELLILLMALVKVLLILLHMKWKGYYHWQWGRRKMDLVSSTLGCKLHAAALFLCAMSLRDHNLFEHVEMHLASSYNTMNWHWFFGSEVQIACTQGILCGT